MGLANEVLNSESKVFWIILQIQLHALNLKLHAENISLTCEEFMQFQRPISSQCTFTNNQY